MRVKGRLRANKWLLLRRISQLGILALFLVGPWFGWWIVKGNLSASLTLGTLPLTDPYLLLRITSYNVCYTKLLRTSWSGRSTRP